MTLSDIGKNIVGIVAPLLGSAIAGPAGAAVGNIVASEFGGAVVEPEELAQKIQADPNAATKLKEIELNNKFQLQQLQIQQAQSEIAANTRTQELSVENVRGARQYNEDLAKIGKGTEVTFLTYSAVATFCLCLVVTVYIAYYKIDINQALWAVFLMFFGSNINSMNTIYNFYFGSSQGSKLKDLRKTPQ